MKISILVLLALLLVPIAGFAQGFSASFTPSNISVNAMSITSFDPDEPASQPLLSYLTVNFPGEPKPRLDVKVRVVWNDLILAEADFESMIGIPPEMLYPVVFTSRQLMSNEGHPYFLLKPGSEAISVESILQSPTFGDAVRGGYFPDGNMEIRVWLRPYTNSSWIVPESSTGDARFTILIRNAGNITLVYPGVLIGQNPPELSGAPLSFLWNAVNTGFNDFELTIREYPESQIPTVNNVESTGYLFYQTPEGANEDIGFSLYLPFQPDKYYAWRVKSKIYTEFNPQDRARVNSPYLSSNWFVFRYTEENDTSSGISELQSLLNLLNNNDLRNIYNSGFNTVGTVIFEGRTYRGQDAQDLVESLFGKEIQVQLQD